MLSRRQLIVGGLAGTVVAACRGGDTATTDVSASSTVTEVSVSSTVTDTIEPADRFPRSVEHGLGVADIPAPPQRVVATADRDQLDVLLAMGLIPVQYGLSGDYDGSPPWIDATMLEGVEATRMADPFIPNLELIAWARPELIVDAWSDPPTHESLAAIAPTVQIKTEITDSWESAQRIAAEACGREAEAEAAIAETAAIIAEQAERLTAHIELTVAIAFLLGDQLSIITGNDIGGRVVSQLGFEVTSTPDGASGNFSLEQIEPLLGDADILLSFDYGGFEAQAANPLFAALPAVTAGRYVTVSSEVASACYQESTLSLRWAASRVADALLTAAEGRGIQL